MSSSCVRHGAASSTGFLHPSLTARNRPDLRAWPQRIVDVLVPVALDQAYSYRVPAGMELAPGDLVSVPLGARVGDRRGLGRRRHGAARPAQPAEGRRGQARHSAAQAGAAQVRRLGVGLHAGAARHGAAHGAAHGRASRPGAREGRRAACRTAPQAHDRGAQPRAGGCSPTAWCAPRAKRRTRPACRPA